MRPRFIKDCELCGGLASYDLTFSFVQCACCGNHTEQGTRYETINHWNTGRQDGNTGINQQEIKNDEIRIRLYRRR